MSVPIIDFKSESVLDEIRKAYTTVGFAVFTNTLTSEDKKTMENWFKTMKDFFELPLETKQKYSYRKENNLGLSLIHI